MKDSEKSEYTKYKSLKKTVWDNKPCRTTLQSFIMKKKNEKFNIHHTNLKDSGEAPVINEVRVNCCPYCNAPKVEKHGKTKNGLQRYKCPLCNRTFTALTGTLLQDHKLSIKERDNHIRFIIRYESLNSSSKNNINSPTTTRYWLEKMFIALKDRQDTFTLRGTVYIDETYYSVIQRNVSLKEDGTKKRGINNNQYDIGVGLDSHGLLYAKVEGRGKPSINSTMKTFAKHIEPCSLLIHDGELSHSALIKELNLKSEIHTTEETTNLKDEDNPLRPINEAIALIKDFLKSHKGFKREKLQDFLNLFVFIYNKPHDEDSKVDAMIQLLMKTKNTLKYRDFYKIKALKAEIKDDETEKS